MSMDKEKHILMGIDGSPGSRDALNYIGLIFSDNPAAYVDLLHILPPVPPIFTEPGQDLRELQHIQKSAAKFEKECRERAASSMEEAKNILTQHNVKEDNLRFLVRPRVTELPREFLSMEKGGIYDAIVLGRRGMSRIEELFLGSLTNNILQLAKKITVCVVDGKIKSKKLLLPIDGSPNSKRAINNAAWLLKESDFTEVTILYVLTPLFPKEIKERISESEQIEAPLRDRLVRDAEELLANAKKRLIKEKIPVDSIQTHLETKSMGVAGSILKFARNQNYNSIMIGRRGISRTKQLFFGSVSHKIIQQAQNMAVWVVS
ncbi:MAG: universal stress protein [Deltaproteobacteria bacterium]|nr:universal stress protein [Deltaproteobacteria bacterium]